MRNFFVFCECKDFGWKIAKNTDNAFTPIIANIELEIGCQLLSFFSCTHWSEKSKIFNLCADVFKLSGSIKKRLRNKQIICIEGVVKAWEVLLQNHQHCSQRKNDIDKQIRNIIKLIIYCQTLYLEPKELEPRESLLTQSVREYRDNFAWLVSRGRFIYTHSEQLNPSLSKRKAEMESKFYKNFSISLKDYFIIISSITSRFHEIENAQGFKHLRCKSFFEGYPLDLNQSLGSLESLHISVEGLLNKLSFGAAECDSVVQDKDKNFVDSCIKKPFFKLSNGRFIPINEKWADDLLWISLYYKIADCYNDKTDFYNLFGYLFENYVCYLTEKTCEFHKSGYQYIPEFSYGKPLKKSPDAMISTYNSTDNINEVLVIEAKSARLLYGMKKDDFNRNDIAQSLKKVIYDPLSQAEKAIADIIQKGVCKEITNEKIFSIVCVSMENIPFQVQIENDQHDLYVNSKGIKAVHIAMSIEEFEMLMHLLSQPQCESVNRDIIFYLRSQKDVHSYGEVLSFKNYINRNTIYPHIRNLPGIMTSISEKFGLVLQIDIPPNSGKVVLINGSEALY